MNTAILNQKRGASEGGNKFMKVFIEIVIAVALYVPLKNFLAPSIGNATGGEIALLSLVSFFYVLLIIYAVYRTLA